MGFHYIEGLYDLYLIDSYTYKQVGSIYNLDKPLYHYKGYYFAHWVGIVYSDGCIYLYFFGSNPLTPINVDSLEISDPYIINNLMNLLSLD